MKRITRLLTSLIVLSAVLLAAGCDSIVPPPSTISTDSGNQQTGIWVSGQGEVTVTPDLAVLQLGVEAQEASVAAAQAAATKAMANVSDALLKTGVQPEDIQTQYFSIRQQTRWDDASQQQVVTGYTVSNTVIAKVRMQPYDSASLDYKTGHVIDAAVSAGGDLIRVDDLSFTVEDPAAYYDDARELATADALDKAQKLAEQNDVRLGPPTYISESSASPVYKSTVYATAVPVPAMTTVPLSPGELKIMLTVQVAYAIQ